MPGVPVGTTTQNPGLQHYAAQIYYAKKFLDRLEPEFHFWQMGYQMTMPRKSGKTILMFRWNLPGANLTPAAEGVNPNPIPQSNYPISATLEQYSDYMDSSTLYDETNPDSRATAVQMVDDLSFRASLSLDTLVRAELDTNTAYQRPTLGAFLSVNDFKAATAEMKGFNVRPYAGGSFQAIIHPFTEYDIKADNTAGGFLDLTKYTSPEKAMNGEIGMVGGTRIMTSTNVAVTGTAPGQLFSSYVFGYQAFAVIPLAGSGPSDVQDPQNQKFKVSVRNPEGGTPGNETGEIGTIAYYRFVTAFRITDPQRMRIILSDASLV